MKKNDGQLTWPARSARKRHGHVTCWPIRKLVCSLSTTVALQGMKMQNWVCMTISTTWSELIIMINSFSHKAPFLTRVKLTALYKQLDKNHIYLYFNKQNLKYSIYHKHNHLAKKNYLHFASRFGLAVRR